jgi:hypothetical protein
MLKKLSIVYKNYDNPLEKNLMRKKIKNIAKNKNH